MNGYEVNNDRLKHYVEKVVEPALENFREIEKELQFPLEMSKGDTKGWRKLDASTGFAEDTDRVLGRLFELYGQMAERQRALTQVMAKFHDNLDQTHATYVSAEETSHDLLRNI